MHFNQITLNCVSKCSKRVGIGSPTRFLDNGLSLVWHRAIIYKDCWSIVNYNLRNTFQWNLDLNLIISIQEPPFWKHPVQHIGHLIATSVCYISSTQVLIYILLMVVALVNTLSPRQNGRHFPDDVYKWIFLNESVWISIKMSLKFVPGGPINNIQPLVQIMAYFTDANMRHSTCRS